MALSRSLTDRIPGELHDRIIEHLHDDLSALLICSLVSHSWLRASRYQFSNLEIRRKNSAVLYRLLRAPHSTLGMSTRRVAIRAGKVVRPQRFLGPLLPAVDSLIISTTSPSTPASEILIWTRYYSHQLVELTLYGVDCDSLGTFVEGLQEFRVLRHLALVYVRWSKFDFFPSREGKDTRTTQTLSSLRSLTLLGDSAHLVRWLLFRNAVSIQRLNLKPPVYVSAKVLSDLSQYYNTLASSLHDIELYQNSNINLSLNVNLRQLWFHNIALADNEWVITALSQVTSVHLHTITLYMDYLRASWGIKAFNWDDFKLVLAKAPFCAQLKLVKVICQDASQLTEALIKTLVEHLPTNVGYLVADYTSETSTIFGDIVSERALNSYSGQKYTSFWGG